MNPKTLLTEGAETYLKSLILATDTIIDNLDPKNPEFSEDAINWADLSCRQAGVTMFFDGTIQLTIGIEEAAPSSYHLGRAIADQLAEIGFPNVIVNVEW